MAPRPPCSADHGSPAPCLGRSWTPGRPLPQPIMLPGALSLIQSPSEVVALLSVILRVGTVGLIGGERMRNHRARMGVAVICLAIVAMLAAACGTLSSTVRTTSASQKVSGTVVVFAAASLKDAFDQIGKQFEQANPGVSVKFNYAGSSSLATQIKQAAPADVFASADTTNMDTVTNDNLASGPKNFASNTL